MRNYVARRVLLAIPTVLLMTILIFVIMRLIPGDAALMMAAGDPDEPGDMRYYEDLKQQLGLDRPFVVQFSDWVWQAVRYGDLGRSYWSREPVLKEILRRMPLTIELAVGSLIIGVALSVPLGVLAATRQDKWGDYIPRVASVLLLSAPNFWIATLLVLLPALWFNYLPTIIYVSFRAHPWQHIQMLLFPWFAVGTRLVGTTLRMTRSSMLEVLRQDYIRTARSKGLKHSAVVYRHALKNALIPVATLVGYQAAGLLEGSVLIETVFNLEGLGFLTVNAISQRDYPQIQASILAIGLIVLLVNLATDVCYALFDPRIRYS